MALILIVDDRAVSRQMLTTLLGYYNHRLIEAGDGVEALELARSHQPDLIIADVLMPTMDGFELVRQLRLDPATALTPVIFYTASYLEKEARQLAASCGVSHILLKPSDPEDILEIVNTALGEVVPAVTPPPIEEFRESHLQLMTGKLSEVVPRLAALIEIGRQLIGSRDPLLLVEQFCHAARDVLGAKYAAVGLLGEDEQTFTQFITSGISPEETTRIGQLPVGKGVLARAIMSDTPFRVADIGADPQSVGFPANHPDMRSFLGAPIMTSTQRYGAFYFADKIGATEFNIEDERVATTLATQIAVAYENALRYAEIQQEVAERRQAEAALRKSEERHRTLFENVPVGLFRAELDGTFLDANPALLEILGFPDLETVRKVNSADLYVVPETRDLWLAMMIKHNTVQDFEALLRSYEGESIWCLINARIDNNGQGEIRYIDGSVQNIHARKQAQQELTALYNALSILFESDNLLELGQQIVQAVVREFGQIDCGLMLVDRSQNLAIRVARAGEFRVDIESPVVLNGTGLVPEAMRTGQLIYAPDVHAHPNYLANDPRTRSELVLPLSTSHGIVGVLDLQSPELQAFTERDQRILIAFGERAGAALETMQLYEEVNRRAAELEWRVAQRTAELQRTTERVEAILNSSSDIVIVLHLDGTITNMNPALTITFGYTADEIFGHPLTMLFDPQYADFIVETMQKVVTDGQDSIRTEIPARRDDGTTFHADCMFSPIKQDDDKIAGLVCSLRDISVRRNMEDELRVALAKEKELSELKSRFVSMVSHEYRTPLAVILASTDIMINYADRLTDERKTDHLLKIQGQVHRLVSLLEDVLTLGKAETVGMEFQPDSLNLENYCQMFIEEVQQATSAEDRIVFTVKQSCGNVLSDEMLLRQIIVNLLSNAVKYSPADSKVYFDLSCDGKQATFRIRDEGIGIPQEDQERLFQAFHRARNVGAISGTGLGLVIIQRAVEAHGGTISFESQEGVGTTFIVTIPLSARNET
ncbi:MAG: PAS domain S-box protein [Aggregatilineales bacterium]